VRGRADEDHRETLTNSYRIASLSNSRLTALSSKQNGFMELTSRRSQRKMDFGKSRYLSGSSFIHIGVNATL
jgi:hypothetical protein